MNDTFISTTIAASEFGCTPKTIERYIRRGLITGVKRMGRYYKIPVREWNNFKARNLKDAA